MEKPFIDNEKAQERFDKAVQKLDEIERLLDHALDTIYDPISIKNGYAKAQKDFFVASISFLKSVNRLPEKFKNFDIKSI